MATVTGSTGRKRPLPSSLLDDNVAPPNKSLPKATERGGDREYLHQKIAEASRNHFFLSPHHIPIYGFSSKPGYTTPPMQAMKVYPFLSHSAARTIDSVNPSVRQQFDCSPSPKGGSQTPYPSPIYPSLLRYQFPPTPPLVNSPQNLGLMQGGNIAHQTQNMTSSITSSARVCNDGITTGAQDQSQTKSTVCHSTSIPSTSTTSSSMPQYIFSPHHQNIHVRSPYSFYNPSPGSPMMMLPSPYASSCPSVSSSSGCSSMSEGSGIVQNFAYQGHRNVAASEYHCGVVPRIINVEDDDDEDEVSEGEEEQHSQLADATMTEEGGRLVTRPASSGNWRVVEGSPLKSVAVDTPSPADSDYPQSVQSQPCTASSTQNCMSHMQSSVDRPSSGISSMSSYLSSRESTPEPDESRKMTIDRTFHHHPATLNDRQPKEDNENDVDGSDLFCMVPGRLSLLSATQKYRVTVDEVQRRLSSPECLNASVLGGILRRAKSKNGGHLLRQRLESIGVSLPPGRRKATDLSLLTSLVEGEALHLSSDFNRLCNNFFPHTELAQIIGRQHVDTPQLQERVTMVKAAQVLMTEFQGMMDAVGGPSNIRPADPDNPYPGLTNFSLITHGFGNPVISTVMSQIQVYLSELLAVYEGKTPLKPDNNSQAPNYAVNSQGRYSLGESSRTVHHCNLKQESMDDTNL